MLSRYSKSSENDRLLLVAARPELHDHVFSAGSDSGVSGDPSTFRQGEDSGLKVSEIRRLDERKDQAPPSCFITVTEAGRGTGDAGGVSRVPLVMAALSECRLAQSKELEHAEAGGAGMEKEEEE